jgi:hypothetical protein
MDSTYLYFTQFCCGIKLFSIYSKVLKIWTPPTAQDLERHVINSKEGGKKVRKQKKKERKEGRGMKKERNRGSWSRGKAPDLYSVDALFQSRPGHRLF